MTTYPTVEAALAEPVERRTGEYLVLHVKSGWCEWMTDADLDEVGAYGFEDEYELVELTSEETAQDTQFSGTLPANPPAFVDSSTFDDPDNG